MDTKLEMTKTVQRVQDKLKEKQQSTDIDWSLFQIVMENTDFTKCQTAMDSLMKFYEQLFTHAIKSLEDEKALLHIEVGKLIIDADENRRKAQKLEEEVTSLREQIQGKSTKNTQED